MLIHPITITTAQPTIRIHVGCLYSFIIDDLVAAIRITDKAIGKMIPFAAPANTRSFTGFPMLINIIVDATINKLMMIFSFLETAGCNVFQNEIEVNDAPTTEVIAAIQITIPKNL